MNKLKIITILLIIFAIPLTASNGDLDVILKSGLDFYGKAEYNEAILKFREIVVDSSLANYHNDAYFWIAKSYLALKQYDNAEKNIEFFLLNFPKSSNFVEMYYQKGRLLFLQKEYEKSIKVFYDFLGKYPTTKFTANSYFWIAESLYSLGHFGDAQKLFNLILSKFPSSYKIEAAKYRSSLIELKYRELELLKLLKMSHEEYLKALEEYQRREASYEQALTIYQKKLSALTVGEVSSDEELSSLSSLLTEKEGSIESYVSAISDLEKKLKELNTTISALKAENEALRAGGGETTVVTNFSGTDNLTKLLQIKNEAITLKEYYLNLIIQSLESENEEE